MRSKEQIDAAAGAYYRINEAKNRNISSAALKSFKDGIRWAEKNPENPWRNVTSPPGGPRMVLVWAKAEDGPEGPLVARYCGDGHFDLFGLFFWTPLYWMPIPTPEMKPCDF